MFKLRKGNNIQIHWNINFKNYSAEISEETIKLFLVNALKEKQEITNFRLEENTITFTLFGKDMCKWKNGKYHLLLILNRCTENQVVLDKRDIFILMETLDNHIASGTTDNIETVTEDITSDISFGLGNIDISNYFTKEEINTILSSYVTKSELEAKDYASKAFVSNALIDYITSGEVSLDAYISKVELNQLGYITSNEVKDFVSYAYLSEKLDEIEIPNVSNLISYAYLSEKLENIEIPEINNLVSYSYLSEKLSDIETPDLSSYITYSYLTNNYYDKLNTHKLIADYIQLEYEEKDLLFRNSASYNITQSDINSWNNKSNFSGSYNDLTDKPEFSRMFVSYTYLSNKDYATQSQVQQMIENIPTQNIDLSAYITKEQLASQTYTSKEYVDNKFANVVLTETDPIFRNSAAYTLNANGASAANRLQYITGSGKLSFDSSINSEDGFLATEKFVLNQVAGIDNVVIKLTQDNYDFLQSNGLINENKIYLITDSGDTVVTEEDLTSYVSKVYLGEQLASYYTKAEIDEMLTNISSGGEISLQGYATQNYVRDYVAGLNHVNYTNLYSNLNTYLQRAYDYADTISSEGIDMTQYATKAYLEGVLENYALNSDIPDTSSLASRSWVASNFMTKSNIDLSPYATKSYVSDYYALKSDVPETSNLVTYTYLDEKIQEIVISGSGVDLSSYLTKTDAANLYQPKGDYKTGSYIDTNYAKKSEIPDISGLATISYVTEKTNNIDISYIVWTGTQTEYNALSDKTQYQIYLIKQS